MMILNSYLVGLFILRKELIMPIYKVMQIIDFL